MVAACRTVEAACRIRCTAISSRRASQIDRLEVERLRDGKSYTTAGCASAWQRSSRHGVVPCRGGSAFDHQDEMPDVRCRKSSPGEVAKQPITARCGIHPPLLRIRPSDRTSPGGIGRYFGQKIDDGRINVWIRTASNCPTIRRCICAGLCVGFLPLMLRWRAMAGRRSTSA
jgi:acyl-CoA thioesterase-2